MNAIKILVLEDHSLTRHMLLLAFQGLGYTNLYSAESGEQAFTLLKAERNFDVLVCDIHMPGIDGLSFLREACEIGHISALIISSIIAADLCLAIQQMARLLGYQVLGGLDKPFSRDELHALMQRYHPVKLNKADFIPELSISNNEVFVGLRDGQFLPYYQPKINLQTLDVVGAEVLVRWMHPEHGLLAPGHFLQSVEQAGEINTMTKLLGIAALRFLREQQLVGRMHLSINLEVSQLALPRLVEDIRDILDSERVPPESLILEVTEGGLMLAPVTATENLVRLRLLGCGIAVDDFGAGFSSLQRVCEMPCTELKLDASFIRSMTNNPRTLAVVKGLLHLTHQLGIDLVAEGVETNEQLVLLKDMGCEIGQGYLFSRPLSRDSFIDWLRYYKRSNA
jgi:EAL domain-containing protein (putative c-di-GMP-specific phosphodiesterase class I)